MKRHHATVAVSKKWRICIEIEFAKNVTCNIFWGINLIPRFFEGGEFMKKALSVALFIVLIFSFLMAKEIVLRVAFWGGPDEIAIETRNLERFMELNPGIKVELESIPDNYREKILTSIAAGTAPDVFLLDSGDVPAFVNNNVLLNLLPYAKRYGVDLSAFYPNVLKIAMIGDRLLYAFPKDFTPLVIYYDKDMFDKAGIPYPTSDWTWDDFYNIAKKLTVDEDGDGRTDQYGFVARKYYYLYSPFVWSNGGDFIDPNGVTASGYFNSSETIEAMTWWANFIKEGISPSTQGVSTLGGYGKMFFSGKVAMVESGHWFLPSLLEYIESGKRVGVVGLPRVPGKEKVNVMYESGWCVPKTSKFKKEAVLLAAFLAGEYAQRTRGELGLAIPAVKTVAEEIAAEDPWDLESGYVEEVKYCRQPWGTIYEFWGQIDPLYTDAMEEIMITDNDPKAIVEKYTERINEILSEQF